MSEAQFYAAIEAAIFPM